MRKRSKYIKGLTHVLNYNMTVTFSWVMLVKRRLGLRRYKETIKSIHKCL